MHLKSTLALLAISVITVCDCALSQHGDIIEARGKKKKIALFVYWADIVIKKIFFLKLFYAFVFWLVLHKAGYFLSWFISYLKEKKTEHHDHHPHYAHHYEHGPPSSYGPPDSYGPPSYNGPYRRQSHGISNNIFKN